MAAVVLTTVVSSSVVPVTRFKKPVRAFINSNSFYAALPRSQYLSLILLE